MNTYYIDGGVGRIIALSGVFKDNPNSLITSYPVVFKNNPNIKEVVRTTMNRLVEDYAIHKDIKVIDPYTEYKFYHDKENLVNMFNLMINNDISYRKPHIYIDETMLTKADDFLKKNNIDKFVLFQPFGREFGKDLSWRSMEVEFAYQTIKICLELGYKVVYINSAGNPIFSYIDGVYDALETEVDLETLFGLAKKADKIIGCDSMLNHLAVAVDNHALIFWTGTDLKNFGYNENINIKIGEPLPYIFHIPLNDSERLKVNPFQWKNKFLIEVKKYLG